GPRRAARSLPPHVLMLKADIQLRLGTLDLDASLDAGPGEVVALLGPNGAGKTTFLRAVAGLVRADRASVVLDGVVLEDTAAGVRAPTERRPIGIVFQQHLLFPHLSVLENVAFGLRARHRPDARAVASSRAVRSTRSLVTRARASSRISSASTCCGGEPRAASSRSTAASS